MLYIDPTELPAQKKAFLNPIGDWIRSTLATLPICNSGTAARADWTSVACLTMYAKQPHLVTYSLVDEVTSEFCMVNVEQLLRQKQVHRFAVRHLYMPGGGVRDEAAWYDKIAAIMTTLNDENSNEDPSPAVGAAKQDDVVLANEIYWRLTGTNLGTLHELTSGRQSVAELFATGGHIDAHPVDKRSSMNRFQFGPEVCGRL